MAKLWLAIVLVITYVSLYPFDFFPVPFDDRFFDTLRDSLRYGVGLDDSIGNFLCFVPFGLVGVLSLRGRDRLWSGPWRGIAFVCAAGACFAMLLQLVQIYLPSRHESFYDAAYNVLGVVCGAVLGFVLCRRLDGIADPAGRPTLVPLFLLGCWLAFRLVPFIPSFDLASIRHSLSPLLGIPQIILPLIFNDIVGWLVTAYLLRCLLAKAAVGYRLPLLIAVVFLLEVLIVPNFLSASNVIGAVIALGLWAALSRREHLAGVLAALIVAMLVFRGLAPFDFRAQPQNFSWLPFQGFLYGNMYVGVLVLCNKVFFYGSLVFVLWQTRMGRVSATLLAATVLAAIEVAQLFFRFHSPEISDPLLIVAAAMTMAMLQNWEKTTRTTGPTTPAAGPSQG